MIQVVEQSVVNIQTQMNESDYQNLTSYLTGFQKTVDVHSGFANSPDAKIINDNFNTLIGPIIPFRKNGTFRHILRLELPPLSLRLEVKVGDS